MDIKIGVLALQGGFAKHTQMLKQAGATPIEVRRKQELEECHGLIIPGGESTTLIRHLEENNLPLETFPHPIFGTCAGMILLVHLGLLNIRLKRNGYGRQLHSFCATLPSTFGPIEGIFIRAPRIVEVSPGVEILAEHQSEPVCVEQGRILATSFHPELTNDPTIHTYFIQRCIKEKQSPPLRLKTTPTKSFQTT